MTDTTAKTFSWTDVPIHVSPQVTYDTATPYGLFGSHAPWFDLVSDSTDGSTAPDDWKVVLREYDPDNDALLPTEYAITHEVVIKTLIELAMNSDYDLDDRAKYLALVIDPENWDTQFDVEDADRILQHATWGSVKYD